MNLISEALNDLHESLCDDCSDDQMWAADKVITYFAKAGIISDEEAHLRHLALHSCPGHNGSRSWCAYCGVIK